MSNTRKSLWLHIGTEKTGTTSIQRFLHQNRAQLLNRGIFVPDCLGHENHKLLAAFALSTDSQDIALRSQQLTDSPAAIAALQARIEKELAAQIEAAPHETYVISSEDLQRLYEDCELEKLFCLLKSLFEQITVVVFLRRQDVLAVSRRYSLLLHGATAAEVFPRHRDKFYDYRALVDRWAKHVEIENVRVIPFLERHEAPDFDAITRFCEAVNISATSLEIPKPLNASLDAVNQIVLLCLNRLGRKVTEEFRTFLLNELAQRNSTKTHFVSQRQAITFYSQFEDGNNEVAQKYLNQASLFSRDFSMYPAENTYQSASETAIARLIEMLNESAGRLPQLPEIRQPFGTQWSGSGPATAP